MGEAIGHFFSQNWFSILASAGTLIGAYNAFRDRIVKMEKLLGDLEANRTDVASRLSMHGEKLVALMTFQAVQTEKNSTQDQRYAELVIWMRSIDARLSHLQAGTPKNDAAR